VIERFSEPKVKNAHHDSSRIGSVLGEFWLGVEDNRVAA
jgi:hypothetical protein